MSHNFGFWDLHSTWFPKRNAKLVKFSDFSHLVSFHTQSHWGGPLSWALMLLELTQVLWRCEWTWGEGGDVQLPMASGPWRASGTTPHFCDVQTGHTQDPLGLMARSREKAVNKQKYYFTIQGQSDITWRSKVPGWRREIRRHLL